MTTENNTQLMSIEDERNARINEVAEELSGMGIPSYSFKDKSIFTPSGAPVINKSIDVVILTDPWDIAVFGEAYNPSSTAPPIAKAFGLRYSDLVFTSDSEEGYAGVKCATHPSCQFGSSQSGSGNGKMAREKRRLFFITADRLKAGTDSLTEGDVFSILIPPATLTAYAKYLKSLPKTSYIGDFITRIRVNPVKETSLDFTMINQITEGRDDLWGLVKAVEAIALTAPVQAAQEDTKKRKY